MQISPTVCDFRFSYSVEAGSLGKINARNWNEWQMYKVLISVKKAFLIEMLCVVFILARPEKPKL